MKSSDLIKHQNEFSSEKLQTINYFVNKAKKTFLDLILIVFT